MQTGIRTLTDTDLQVTTNTNQETLGAVGATADGRKFRYVQTDAVAGLNIGELGVAAATIADHTNLSLNTTSNEAVGSNVVVVDVGATACQENQYAGGYLVIRDGAGAGAAYRIDGNSYSAGNGPVVVTLFDVIATALDTATTVVDLISPFAGVAASTTLSDPVGVAQVNFAPGYFGWVQTNGYASVLCEGGFTPGGAVGQSQTTAGALAAGTTYNFGVALDTVLDTEYGAVDLRIA